MAAGLILEGVTGTGKSSTLAALAAREDFRTLLADGGVFPEEVTFGEFVRESRTDPTSLARLESVLAEVETRSRGRRDYFYVLERFHHSYFAFSLDWGIYAGIERRLRALNCSVVLLTIPPREMELRSLRRADMAGTAWVDEVVGFYGSPDLALAGLAASQERRREALARGSLPSLEIETTDRDWNGYADAIMSFWSRSVPAWNR